MIETMTEKMELFIPIHIKHPLNVSYDKLDEKIMGQQDGIAPKLPAWGRVRELTVMDTIFKNLGR